MQVGIFEEKAFSSYRTPSMYLRDCALDKKIVVINGVDELASELRKIGNNLNQLTRLCNEGRVKVAELKECRGLLMDIYGRLGEMLKEVK